MGIPRGVSLVEVLVASVLLTVGVGGAVRALLAAAQLRERAAARESVTRAAEARLDWFQQAACATADTVESIIVSGPIEETWRVTRGGGLARIEGRATMTTLGGPVRVKLAQERQCP